MKTIIAILSLTVLSTTVFAKGNGQTTYNYACKAFSAKSAASAAVPVTLAQSTSPSGALSIGGRGDNSLVNLEIDEQSGFVKATLKHNDQSVEMIGGFTQVPNSQAQAFQASLTTESNSLAGAGAALSIECSRH